MSKNFDILNDKALAVFDDRLPVVVKYNGETLPKLSALTKNVNNSETNINEVSYTSEYNKSLRNFEIKGNTFQQTYTGTNLATAYQIFKDNRNYTELEFEGKDAIRYDCGGYTYNVIESGFKENTQYTLSGYFQTRSKMTDGSTDGAYLFHIRYTDGSTAFYLPSFKTDAWTSFKYTTASGKTVKSIGNANSAYKNYVYIDVDTFQINEGTQVLPYEPYVGGIPSPNPGHTIKHYTENEVVTIDCTEDLQGGITHSTEGQTFSLINSIPILSEYDRVRFFINGEFNTGDATDIICIGSSDADVRFLKGDTQILAKGDGTKYEALWTSNKTKCYVGVGKSSGKPDWNNGTLYKSYVLNASVSQKGIELVETSSTTIPAYPQAIENANSNGMSVVFRGKNIFDKNNIDKTRALTNDSSVFNTGNIATYNCAIIPCSPNTIYIKSGNFGASVTAFLDKDENFLAPASVIANGTPFKTPSDCAFIVVNLLVANAPYDDCQVEKGTVVSDYEPYLVFEKITIPTSVTNDGTDVPLLFSEYDKITVNKNANKVIYTEGSWQRTMTGNESWTRHTWAYNNGYGTMYVLNIGYYYDVTPTYNNGYTNYFKRAAYGIPMPFNSFAPVQNEKMITICTDRETPVADFKLWLQEKYNEGNPLTILVQRATPLEHDITNTDLGKQILDLTNKIPYGTIFLEVNSDLTVPIEVGYAKWGGDISEDEE